MDDQIESLLREAARTLRANGARDVYVFGSVIDDKNRKPRDIDMAVSGLPPEFFFSAMGEVGDLLECPFDLIDLDEDNPFTTYLKSKGKLVRVE